MGRGGMHVNAFVKAPGLLGAGVRWRHAASSQRVCARKQIWTCSAVQGGNGTTSSLGGGEGTRTSSGSEGRKLLFRQLNANEFRHPLDTQATRMLSSIFGIDLLVRSVISPVVEQTMFLDNISSGILVGPNQLTSIYDKLVEACRVLNIDQIPDLYIRQNPVPNAYTLAIQGKKPFIVIHTSLIELLSEQELQAVIAHELGHLKCEHGIWLTLANLMVIFSDAVFGERASFVVESLRAQVLRWLRSAELSCDRAALLVAQDPKIVISMMMKLVGGSSKISPDLNVTEYMKQAQEYEKASQTRMGNMIRRSQTDYLTHPLPILRVTAIENWAASTQYRSLIRRAKAQE